MAWSVLKISGVLSQTHDCLDLTQESGVRKLSCIMYIQVRGSLLALTGPALNEGMSGLARLTLKSSCCQRAGIHGSGLWGEALMETPLCWRGSRPPKPLVGLQGGVEGYLLGVPGPS